MSNHILPQKETATIDLARESKTKLQAMADIIADTGGQSLYVKEALLRCIGIFETFEDDSLTPDNYHSKLDDFVKLMTPLMCLFEYSANRTILLMAHISMVDLLSHLMNIAHGINLLILNHENSPDYQGTSLSLYRKGYQNFVQAIQFQNYVEIHNVTKLFSKSMMSQRPFGMIGLIILRAPEGRYSIQLIGSGFESLSTLGPICNLISYFTGCQYRLFNKGNFPPYYSFCETDLGPVLESLGCLSVLNATELERLTSHWGRSKNSLEKPQLFFGPTATGSSQGNNDREHDEIIRDIKVIQKRSVFDSKKLQDLLKAIERRGGCENVSTLVLQLLQNLSINSPTHMIQLLFNCWAKYLKLHHGEGYLELFRDNFVQFSSDDHTSAQTIYIMDSEIDQPVDASRDEVNTPLSIHILRELPECTAGTKLERRIELPNHPITDIHVIKSNGLNLLMNNMTFHTVILVYQTDLEASFTQIRQVLNLKCANNCRFIVIGVRNPCHNQCILSEDHNKLVTDNPNITADYFGPYDPERMKEMVLKAMGCDAAVALLEQNTPCSVHGVR